MVHLNGRAWPEAELEHVPINPSQSRPDRSAPLRRSRASGRGPKPLLPRSLKEALQLAELLSKSKLIPKGFETPETCLVGILYGMEVGLSPIAALQRMAVIDGRPTIWGDAALALVQASGLLQSIEEEIIEKEETDHRKILTAICKVKREGRLEPTTGTFSIEDAKRAGLWQKPGPWTDYPKRMLTMRARAFALRDAFPDVLAGLYIREEFEGANSARSKTSILQTQTDDGEWSKAVDHMQSNVNEPMQEGSAGAVEINNGATQFGSAAGTQSRDRMPTPIRRAPPPPPEDIDKENPESKPSNVESQGALNSTETNQDERAHIDPETLLDLFDSALCCALDLPTLDEIVDEFMDRLRHLSREYQDRAQKIIERHQTRVEALDQNFGPHKFKEPVEEPVLGGVDHVLEKNAQNRIEEELPRGLKSLLPNLGLGSIAAFGRRRQSHARQRRSLASWNARQKLQKFKFKNKTQSDLEDTDATEVLP